MWQDNLKGFRTRGMIKKLGVLMKELENEIDYLYDEAKGTIDDYSMEGAMNYANELEYRVTELEDKYSTIWRIKIQLEKGIRTSKSELEYVNEVSANIGRYY